MTTTVNATCHCGAVQLTLATPSSEVTHCNCSWCRKAGVTWVYLDHAELLVPEAITTDTYAWNGRHVDFHRCRTCGCVTHWIPRDATRTRRGVNANLLPPGVFAAARIRHRDGAISGKYID